VSVLSGCKITKLEPLPTATEAFYDIANFKVELTGVYHDFGQFMSYCANFPFITNISEMDIKSMLAAGPGQVAAPVAGGVRTTMSGEPETIVATFKLSTYYVRPEGRLQELAIVDAGVKK